jgi:hypothetical protein
MEPYSEEALPLNEHGYIRSIHRLLPTELFKWKIHDNYAGGVPDCFYAGPTAQLWVEYKWLAKLPAMPKTMIKPKLSAQQLAWLIKMSGLSFPCAVIIGTPHGGLLLDDPFKWTNGLMKKKAETQLITTQDLAKKIHQHCTG